MPDDTQPTPDTQSPTVGIVGPIMGMQAPVPGALAPIEGPLPMHPGLIAGLPASAASGTGPVEFTPDYYKALQVSHGEKPKSKRKGRPSKLTPELQEAICARLEKGNYIEVAAAAEGVDRMTLFSWMRRARDGNTDFKAFIIAIERSIAIGEAKDVDHIDAHAPMDWRAAAWRLSHRAPRRWGDSKGERPDTDPMTGSPVATVQDGQGLGLLAERLANLDPTALVDLVERILGPPGRQLPPAVVIDVVPGPAPSGAALVTLESPQSSTEERTP